MGLYTYKLHKNNSVEEEKKTYKEKNLKLMTTYQLREICAREKLIKSIVNPLDKEELIKLILKYRGEDDALLVESYEEEGLQRVEDFLKRNKKEIKETSDIDYPGKITLYEDMSLDIYDNYILKGKKHLSDSNVLLIDSSFKVCSILNLRNFQGKCYLTKSRQVELKRSERNHYSLLLVEDEVSELIYHLYQGKESLEKAVIKIIELPLIQLVIEKPEETDIPLSIDFGTSNTTAGIYVDREIFRDMKDVKGEDDHKVKLVEVLDSRRNKLKMTPLIPSVVGVKKINSEKTSYIFGYEALKEAEKRYIDDGFTIFYDIKRWISNYEKEEKVIDADENTAYIKRKEIIKAYLLYVINLADQRFKCRFKNIYISCPSKQKYKYHLLFKEILKDYTLESENILEESAAVLYNTISDLIERKKYAQNQWYKALIIDCGGGTTDLTGCSFLINNNRVSYSLDIETSYENGDTDFGGNNLTFRILQFIKILMSKTLRKEDLTIKKAILDEFDLDIFRFVDSEGINKLYEVLDNEYEKCEEVIPTKFKLYENSSKDDYCKVRSNYYFLFNLAEEVKKYFFSNPDLLSLKLTSKEEAGDTIKFDKWKLSYFNKNSLQSVKEAPEITLSIYEISTLLKGDIYNIIKKFLEKLYEKDELYDYSLIKLTGQSCRVDIFKDALKEFIPGRIIEVNKGRKNESDEYELKLACIKGALKYLYSRNFGYADIRLESKTNTLPYVVTAFTHTGEEKTLIKGAEVRQGHISRFMDKIILKLYLKSTDNQVKYEYNYSFNKEDLEKTEVDIIGEKYPNINQHETDNIENNEVKFFVWSLEDLWGFKVLSILRQDDELYLGKEQFFYFENDQWEKNFFDGMK